VRSSPSLQPGRKDPESAHLVRCRASLAKVPCPNRQQPLRIGDQNRCSCPRLCKNAQEPTMRRIVFSIAHFLIAATALFLFRLTKSRKTFYVQVECLCFHTA